jgi:hypothetical protein
MKIPKPFLFLFAAVVAIGALNPAHARAQVSVSFFYDNLSPYGEWVNDPDYGYCWHPTNVDENWAPYTDGYWAYTDQGWTWVSYEDYGGIVYHYGRWAHLEDEGWVWVPGYQWAPAWVSWRSNDDYVGWAPLPPEARFRAGFGFGGGVDAQFDIGPRFYSFVGVGDFGAPALGQVIVNRERNVTIINKTTNITNITTYNSNVYNGGPNYAKIAARSTRPVPTLKLVRQGSVGGAHGRTLARQQGNQLLVLAPKVTAPASGKLPPPAKVAKTLTGVKNDKGWSGADPTTRQSLESKFKAEGPTAAAKPVNPEDVKVVTEKAAVAPKAIAAGATPKFKKIKPTAAPDLLNAPATEEPGIVAATPVPKKGKARKTHAVATPGGFEPSAVETPEPKFIEPKTTEPKITEPKITEPKVTEPKIPKARKVKTPNLDEPATGDTGAPKRFNGGDANLQPFNDGSKAAPGYVGDTAPRGPATGGGGEKPEKKKKKSKGEATPGE